MKTTTAIFGTILIMALMLSPVSSYAVPNPVQNGDFENGLNHWTTFGRNAPDSRMAQTVDMPDLEDFRLSLDFTMVTLKPSRGDDFRAEMGIDFLGGGPYTPAFSYGTGDGVFQDYGPDDDKSNMLLDNIKVYAVPEPGTISLLILGLSMAGAGFIRRKNS